MKEFGKMKILRKLRFYNFHSPNIVTIGCKKIE